MNERNEAKYQLEQDNKIFFLTTSLIDGKLNMMCQDSSSQKFIGEFNMNELLQLSGYFSAIGTLEQAQIYINGIIEKQRIGIFEGNTYIRIILYLVNNDKIIIPLNKKESFIVKNNFNNYNEYRNQYIRKQNKKTSMDSSYNCDINNYAYQELLDITPSYKYHQNPIEYLNNSYSHHNNIENNINQNINNSSKRTIVSQKNIESNHKENISYNNYNMNNLEDNIKNEIDDSVNLKKENELYKIENSSLLNENNTLKNENEKFRTEILNYQNKIKKYKDENDSLKNKLVQNNSNISIKENNELMILKEIYEKENQKLKDNLEQIDKENKMLKMEIIELKDNITIISNHNKLLINEISELKRNLENQKNISINEYERKGLIEENNDFRIKVKGKTIEDLENEIEINKNGEDSEEIKGDIIHDMKELEMLIKKINKNNKKIIINLLYKASADGDKASIFHEKCDKANNSIVLVETKDKMRFGGFTTCNWSGNCIDKNDPEAFIFSFDKMKTYDNIPGDEAIGCYPKFGPIFLGCQIKIFDNAFINGGTTFEKELNYKTNEDFELTGGKRNFKIKDIEVYEVIFE